MSEDNEDKCPVMHGCLTSNSASGTSNQDWWPNQLNLNILHPHDQTSAPLAECFDYLEEFQKLDYHSLKTDLHDLMTASLAWSPADYVPSVPFFIRLTSPAAGPYRI